MGSIAVDDVEKEMRSHVAEILEIDEKKITSDAGFVEDLGMDSMMALEILASAEKKYKVKIPEENLGKIKNLRGLIDVVMNIIGAK